MNTTPECQTGTALITGAGRGIGRALAATMAAAGWTVLGTVRDPAQAVGLAEDAEVGSTTTSATRWTGNQVPDDPGLEAVTFWRAWDARCGCELNGVSRST